MRNYAIFDMNPPSFGIFYMQTNSGMEKFVEKDKN